MRNLIIILLFVACSEKNQQVEFIISCGKIMNEDSSIVAEKAYIDAQGQTHYEISGKAFTKRAPCLIEKIVHLKKDNKVLSSQVVEVTYCNEECQRTKVINTIKFN